MGRAKQLGDEHIIIVENPEVLTAEMVYENREEMQGSNCEVWWLWGHYY